MSLKTSDFDYHLPQERIAQTPVQPRDASRLFVVNRETGENQHNFFHDITALLRPGDLLVVNETRVIPARIYAKKAETGGKIELLLLNRRDDLTWECLVGGKRMIKGKRIELPNGLQGEILDDLTGARRLVRFDAPLDATLDDVGQMPLPPYIHEKLNDPERYQTVFAQNSGSAAAPTAGLHFTSELLADVQTMGVGLAKVTLHVGLDTFAPVHEEDVADHQIHTEWCKLTPEVAARINDTKARGGRVVAVGTTSVRTLESAGRTAQPGEAAAAFEGPTDIFITPGYTFKVVDAMITNFHLPRSTLLMLVSAFAGRERMLAAYQTAIEMEYRFFSFGDAMFLA